VTHDLVCSRSSHPTETHTPFAGVGWAASLPTIGTVKRWLVTCVVLACSGTAAAQLNDVEQRIVAAAKSRSPHALALLEKAARINSGTLNADGVRAVGNVFRAELDALGFTTRWAVMPPEMKRAGHLVATRESGGKRLLLLGHLDTVFEPDSTAPLWERRGDRVRGQGVNDMKGGNVVIVEALRALQAAGALDGVSLAVVMTGDEERLGQPPELARADIVEQARRSAAALSFEAGIDFNGQSYATLTRRSAGAWQLTVRGQPGHASGVFTRGGYGAIYEAARILNAFREQLAEADVTFNPGVLLGGTSVTFSDDTSAGTAFGKTNVIARDVVVRGDMRFPTAEHGARLKRRMQEIVAAHLPGTSARIDFRDGYPPMPATDASRLLLDVYSRASADAGFGTVQARGTAGAGASGDIQFAAPHTAAIDSLGVTGRGAHTDDEDMEIASLERATIRAALFIHRLAKQP
jgi:glutamate carboxypeptidase